MLMLSKNKKLVNDHLSCNEIGRVSHETFQIRNAFFSKIDAVNPARDDWNNHTYTRGTRGVRLQVIS